ncbi:PhoX family protein OS=Streptomyces alboniger OX=132473 GN=CP975_28230 PE=4 SV=1 [Streptomyces alboniger]
MIVFGPGTDIQLPGESPDNICLAPSGGLMVCEDGDGVQHVYGLTRQGEVYAMARNRQNIGTPEKPEWGEFAGVAFSPDEDTIWYCQLLHPGNDVRGDGPLAQVAAPRPFPRGSGRG